MQDPPNRRAVSRIIECGLFAGFGVGGDGVAQESSPEMSERAF